MDYETAAEARERKRLEFDKFIARLIAEQRARDERGARDERRANTGLNQTLPEMLDGCRGVIIYALVVIAALLVSFAGCSPGNVGGNDHARPEYSDD
jgi:hypothetical protein